MFFSLDSFALIGIDAIKVSVEVHISNGLPSFTIVGLPDKAINESRQRVRAAIINSGFKFPMKRIIINLSPANIKKEGAFYDLPIAVSILAVSGQIESNYFKQSCFIGELSLDGMINSVRGIISMTERAVLIGKKYFFVPNSNSFQASVLKNINIIPCRNLKEVLEFLSDKKKLIKNIYRTANNLFNDNNHYDVDMSDIKGQLKAKRALEIPPGAGKTMLAHRAITTMPDLSLEESIEVTKIYSLHKEYNGELINKRPFRRPHHTISRISFIGGGIIPKPGEISLSHRGVLFLDEFSQFPNNIIEDLRQPLENGNVIISRNNISNYFPCNFMLIIAINPCYCGFYGDEKKECICSIREVRKFWKKLSGPVLDRIDMRVYVPRLKKDDFLKDDSIEKSSEIKKRVRRCMNFRNRHFKGRKIHYNSETNINLINSWLKENKKVRELLPKMLEKYNLTARGVVSVLKVSRTIADLDNFENIQITHIMEALQYRTKINIGDE
jgi:magnesium chelatase family protein